MNKQIERPLEKHHEFCVFWTFVFVYIISFSWYSFE